MTPTRQHVRRPKRWPRAITFTSPPGAGRSATAAATLAALAVVASLSTSARAQTPTPPSDDSPSGDVAPQKPWYQGVSDADRKRAGTLFAQGAALHKQKRHADAVNKYREALKHWDNPDIHFNLIQAHIALDQPLEAYASLKQATRYGLAIMTAKDRVRARDYKRLLEGHLVALTVRCDQPGVEVTLDGQQFFIGPGTQTRWVLPDEHRIRATKADYLDYEELLSLPSGEPKTLSIELISRSQLAVVAISCVEPEAEISLDDQEILACPGRVEKELLSRRSYAVAIERPGHLGEQKTITPEPGERLDVPLRTTEIALQPKLRWSRALPLSVVTAGLAVGIVGGVMQNQAVDNMSNYDSEIDARCGPPVHGCEPDMVPAEVVDLKTSAERQNRLGVGMMLTGGAIIAAGLTLVILNSPRAKRVQKPSEPARTVVPTITPKGVGLVTKIRF